MNLLSTCHSCPDRITLKHWIVIALKHLIKSFYQIDTKWYSNQSTIEYEIYGIQFAPCALRLICIFTSFSIIYSINFTHKNIKQRMENNSIHIRWHHEMPVISHVLYVVFINKILNWWLGKELNFTITYSFIVVWV